MRTGDARASRPRWSARERVILVCRMRLGSALLTVAILSLGARGAFAANQDRGALRIAHEGDALAVQLDGLGALASRADASARCTTPCALTLPVGTYRLRSYGKNTQPIVTQVTVDAAGTELTLNTVSQTRHVVDLCVAVAGGALAGGALLIISSPESMAGSGSLSTEAKVVLGTGAVGIVMALAGLLLLQDERSGVEERATPSTGPTFRLTASGAGFTF